MEVDGTRCSHKERHRHRRSDVNMKDRTSNDAHVNRTNSDYQQNSDDASQQNTSSYENDRTEQRLDQGDGRYDNNRSTNEIISRPSSTVLPFTTRQGSARFESRPVSRAQSRLSRPGSRKVS